MTKLIDQAYQFQDNVHNLHAEVTSALNALFLLTMTFSDVKKGLGDLRLSKLNNSISNLCPVFSSLGLTVF